MKWSTYTPHQKNKKNNNTTREWQGSMTSWHVLTFLLLSLRCWTNFIRSAGSVMILKLNFSTERHWCEERTQKWSNTNKSAQRALCSLSARPLKQQDVISAGRLNLDATGSLCGFLIFLFLCGQTLNRCFRDISASRGHFGSLLRGMCV